MIKATIQCNSTIPTSDWEQGWDAVSTLAKASSQDGILTSDSSIEGTFNPPVCSKSERADLQSRFHNLSINPDSNLQQFEDKGICRVFASHSSNGLPMTKSVFSDLTTIGTWLQNNTEIKVFGELSETKVTTLTNNAFSGCSNLEFVDFSTITTLGTLFTPSNISVLFYPRLTKADYIVSKSSSKVKAVFTPSLIECLRGVEGSVHPKIIDYGDKIQKITSIYIYVTVSTCIYICRNVNVPTISGTDRTYAYWFKKLYVPSASLSQYTSYSVLSSAASVIYAIGGAEWQADMQSLAAEEGYTLKPGESWADEYIDYKIYGIEPPTE